MELIPNFSIHLKTEEGKDIELINYKDLKKIETNIFQIGAYVLKTYRLNSSRWKREKVFQGLIHENILEIQCAGHGYQDINGKKDLFSFTITNFCPNGTLYDLISNVLIDEDMIRTYFRKLVSAIEFLYSKDIYHLDIKLENLYLDEKFNLKLADFDNACTGDMENISNFTEDYDAPEARDSYNYDKKQAEVYAMGVCLRKMIVAYQVKNKEMDNIPISYNFKYLVNLMIHDNPESRPTLQQIKETDWYQGYIYSDTEVENFLRRKLNLFVEN